MSVFSASLGALPGLPQQERQQTNFTPATFTPSAVPEAPATGVANPTTAAQKDFLTKQFDPKSSTYIGNKYLPAIQQAGRELREALAPYGDYEFSDGAMGTLTPRKGDTGQPGRAYREAYQGARAQAAAAGMLYSRSADSAVGEAWSRLAQDERSLINQYSGVVSQQLSALQGEFSGLQQQLLGLYGQDIQYALENPLLQPDAAAPAVDDPAATAAPSMAAAIREWIGKGKPNLKTLSESWGVPISQIEYRQRGAKSGGGYVARLKGDFKG